MLITLARSQTDHVKGVKTFYLSSLTEGDGKSYAVKVVRRHRRFMTCECPDFFHRAQPLGRACKHIRIVRDYLRHIGGPSRMAPGTVITVKWGNG